MHMRGFNPNQQWISQEIQYSLLGFQWKPLFTINDFHSTRRQLQNRLFTAVWFRSTLGDNYKFHCSPLFIFNWITLISVANLQQNTLKPNWSANKTEFYWGF